MRLPTTKVLEFERRKVPQPFTTGISLHSHTNRSREVMATVPGYLARIPVVSSLVQRKMDAYQRRNNRSINFNEGWWRPPVTPEMLWISESTQIVERLELEPLVSITDHDTMDGCLDVRSRYDGGRVPISFEWTMPFGGGFFHVGVHNLPIARAHEIFNVLARYTSKPNPSQLRGLLEMLDDERETLVILNHPVWDLAHVGPLRHLDLLRRFLREHVALIHATEINGYRSWRENSCALKLAADWDLPVVSGGDRHGRAANSLINLTRASTFAEFVQEVRVDRRSTIVVMPEYRTSLEARKLAVVSDVMRNYPNYPTGEQRWTDRVFYDHHGIERPLSKNWPSGGPMWVRASIRAFQMGTTRPMLPLFLAFVSLVGAATPDTMNPSTYIESTPDGSRRKTPPSESTVDVLG